MEKYTDYYELRRCEGTDENPFWNDIVKFIVVVSLVALMLLFSSCRTVRSTVQQHKTSVHADTLVEKLIENDESKESRVEQSDVFHGQRITESIVKHDSMAIHTDSNGVQSYHHFHNSEKNVVIHDTIYKNKVVHDTLWRYRNVYVNKEHDVKDSIDENIDEVKVVERSWWDKVCGYAFGISIIFALILSARFIGKDRT